jgi:malate dehydrogenase (oxaloacetate-decarboxylating)
MLVHLTGRPMLGADLSEEAMQRFAQIGGQPASLAQIMAEADIVIATTGAPGLIRPELVRPGQIILALSNPVPEIEPQLAMEAGAAFAADGKVVNNVLGFPGILRGAVDANATRISQGMYLAAADKLAELTPPGELLPNPLDKAVHATVAQVVARQAIQEGLAQAEFVPYIKD